MGGGCRDEHPEVKPSLSYLKAQCRYVTSLLDLYNVTNHPNTRFEYANDYHRKEGL